MDKNSQQQQPTEKKEEATKIAFNSKAPPFVPNTTPSTIPYYYPYVYYPYYPPAEECEDVESSESENEMEQLNEYYSSFVAESKDCPCCNGYTNACKGTICKDLGQCYCKAVRETEADIKAPIAK